jgi:transcriptional regulator with XRE-family HTH domain
VIGIEPVTLSRLETGDRALSLSSLGRISEALAVPLGDLLDGARELPEPPESKPEHADLVRLFDQASVQRQALLLALARELAKGG